MEHKYLQMRRKRKGEWVQESLGTLCINRDEVQGVDSLQVWLLADLAPRMHGWQSEVACI